MRSHYADKVRSIMAKRRMGAGQLGNVVAGRPKASGKDNTTAPMGSGEYVLPKDFVDKVGGPDVLDQHVMQTLGNVTPPDGNPKKGFWGGGFWGGDQSHGYGEGGEIIPGATGSGWTSSTGQGPVGDPSIEPTPIPEPTPDRRVHVFNERNPNQGYHPVRDDTPQDWLGTQMGNWYGGVSRYNPYTPSAGGWGTGVGPGFNPPPGSPGASQGPVLPSNPSYYDQNGYPWAAPVNTSDNPLPHPHWLAKSKS